MGAREVEAGPPVVTLAPTATAAPPTVASWPVAAPLPEREPNVDETITFDVVQGPDGMLQWRLNGESNWRHPIFTCAEGDTVRLILVNQAGPEHPFHLHGQFFRIMRRNGVAVTGEPGLKDTVRVRGVGSSRSRSSPTWTTPGSGWPTATSSSTPSSA